MGEDDDEDARPALILMPEYMVDMPVWHGPASDGIGNVSAEKLTALGVSLPLIDRLREWQQGWDHDPFTSGSPQKFWPGSPLTVRLARHLQRELPGYRILLESRDGPRPIEEWTD